MLTFNSIGHDDIQPAVPCFRKYLQKYELVRGVWLESLESTLLRLLSEFINTIPRLLEHSDSHIVEAQLVKPWDHPCIRKVSGAKTSIVVLSNVCKDGGTDPSMVVRIVHSSSNTRAPKI